MKKMTLLVLLMFLGTTPAIAYDYACETEPISELNSKLEGKWKASIETPNGDFEFTVNYKIVDKKLTGTFYSDQGELSFTDGTISGNNFEYTLNLNETKHKHKGKLTGDTIVIKYSSGETEGEFSMKRVKK